MYKPYSELYQLLLQLLKEKTQEINEYSKLKLSIHKCDEN